MRTTLWRKEFDLKVFNETIKTFISRKGKVICEASVAETHTCFKWRSELACKDCPMQELMKRSKANRSSFMFETTESS